MLGETENSEQKTKQQTKRLLKHQKEENESEVNKNKVKAKQMVAVLVDLKEEIQQTLAAALATQPEHEPQLRRQQPGPGPGPTSAPMWNTRRGHFGGEHQPAVHERQKRRPQMDRTICFACGMRGHWRNECPNQYPIPDQYLDHNKRFQTMIMGEHQLTEPLEHPDLTLYIDRCRYRGGKFAIVSQSHDGKTHENIGTRKHHITCLSSGGRN